MSDFELLARLELAAASGLVHHGDSLYVVADDALELVRTSVDGVGTERLPLAELPPGATLIKKEKADLEALLLLGDSVLVFGSGSKKKRRRGFHQPLSGEKAREIDLGPLYVDLERFFFNELNVEGAVVRDDEVLLAQRGNGERRLNALVHLDRARFEADLAQGVISPDSFRSVEAITLPSLKGVPLSLTDLAIGPQGELLCTAAAEATDDPYLDGVVMGSVVAHIPRGAQPVVQATIDVIKLEGLCFLPNGELRLVADPDEAGSRAPLFRLGWPR
jgi:hypothetical protein